MKIFLMLVLFLLAACAPAQSYEVVVDGATLKVDTEHRVIRDGAYEYQYMLVDDIAEVIYPDGVTYREQGGASSYSSPCNSDFYLEGPVLIKALEKAKGSSFQGIFPLLLAALGVFHLIAPEKMWQISRIYMLFKGKPDEKAIVVARTTGLLLFVAGILWLVF